jgi:hypothetical protein
VRNLGDDLTQWRAVSIPTKEIDVPPESEG